MIHIHKWGKWETQILIKKQYISGYMSETEMLVAVKKCEICGKPKKHNP